ncbi:CDP-glucose 4,6-dehydratase, partial [Escherichia coli]|nr:CDP-glucose 4,6-dehydratase [Escherichia coli]
WIVDEMARRWGNGAGWEQDPGANPHEAHLLRLDISKARIELGWRPSWSLDVALDRIVEWHRQYLAGADMRAVTLGQIAAFQESRA